MKQSTLVCLLAGLAITLLQIGAAILASSPDLKFSDRYLSLVQHDSYWFANIVSRGYGTTVPPADHKVMEVSNVAFFPAYPMIAGALHSIFKLPIYYSLLLTAQLAAWGFWTYYFLFCERWQLSIKSRFFGALLIAAHPAAFYLIAGYSESLFLMMLAGFVYWSSTETKGAKLVAAIHGFVMAATRIVGVVCAGYPIVRAIFQDGWNGIRDVKSWPRRLAPAFVVSGAALLGALFFFLYCQLRWSRWDIYMLTQESGWAITPDYFAMFKLNNYRWLLPPLDDPTLASQFTTTLAAVLFVIIAVCEFLPAIRRNTNWPVRIGIYFCAVVIFTVSLAGVASVRMESMLRYDFCVHALIVLALLHYLHQFRMPSVLGCALGMAGTALICAAGLSLEGWYLWNFTRGNWIA